MSWPSLLVLVRHAESDGNVRTVEERAAYEVPTQEYALTPHGHEQARIMGEVIQREYPEGFNAYLSSHYRRARETMDYLIPEGVEPLRDPRLCEMERGIFHTYTQEEVERYFPLELRRKERVGFYDYRPPGGENGLDVELRAQSIIQTLKQDYGGKRVLLVVHSGWLVFFQRIVHRSPIEVAVRRFKDNVFDNASITVYHRSAGSQELVLERENVAPWKDILPAS